MPCLSEQSFALGKLLAGMTRADKRLLGVEDANAEALLECIVPEHKDQAILAYNQYKNVFTIKETDHFYGAMIVNLSVAQKIEALKALWSVALCDGEIHDDEKAFMLRVTEQMMLSSAESKAALESIPSGLKKSIV